MSDYTEQQQLILSWQKKKNKKEFSKIMDSLSPIINYEVNRWTKGGTVPRSAIELQARSLVANSLHTYDPKKASVSTFVVNQMKPISRTVYSTQNLGKIPEARIAMIGSFKVAKNQLHNELGRDPSTVEIAEHMKLPIKTISLLERELLSERSSTSLTDSLYSGKGDFHASELLENLYYSSGEPERVVLEHLTGLHGKKKLPSMSSIAKKTGLTAYQVRTSRETLKKTIGDHLKPYQALL